MTKMEKFIDTVKDRPKRVIFSVFLIVFWIGVPITSQAYLDYSAVNISFIITIIYYIGFQIYKRFYR